VVAGGADDRLHRAHDDAGLPVGSLHEVTAAQRNDVQIDVVARVMHARHCGAKAVAGTVIGARARGLAEPWLHVPPVERVAAKPGFEHNGGLPDPTQARKRLRPAPIPTSLPA
jgi:hypothetical protein